MQENNSGIEQVLPNELSSVDRVVAVMSGKGGVGKSSVTALAAVELQRRGLRVGILDGDITGPSIPKLFGVTKEQLTQTELGLFPATTGTGIQIMSVNLLLENDTDPVIWRGPLIGNMVKQFFSEVVWGELDVVIVDLPPGTGDAPLSTMQSLPLDGIIIVSSPQDVAVLVVEKAIKMARLMDKPILGLIENMVGFACPNCGEVYEVFGQPQGEELASKYGIPWLGGLPVDPVLAGATGTIEGYQSPVPEVIRRLADAVMGN